MTLIPPHRHRYPAKQHIHVTAVSKIRCLCPAMLILPFSLSWKQLSISAFELLFQGDTHQDTAVVALGTEFCRSANWYIPSYNKNSQDVKSKHQPKAQLNIPTKGVEWHKCIYFMLSDKWKIGNGTLVQSLSKVDIGYLQRLGTTQESQRILLH